MLNILPVILKIIGIILLIAIILIVAAVLTVLFSPVRYEVSGGYRDGGLPHFRLNMTWICKIFRAWAQYENGLSYEVKVFGKRIISRESSDTQEENAESAENEAAKAETSRSAGDDKTTTTENSATSSETITSDEPIESGDSRRSEETPSDEETSESRTQAPSEHLSIGDRIDAVVDGLKQRMSAAAEYVENLCEKVDGFRNFINDESHRRAFALIWESLKRLIGHAGPKKLKGHAVFGFEDPSVTGYVLAALSAMPIPWDMGSEKGFDIVPIFNQKVMDIDAAFRGRVKPVVPVRLGLKIWFDDDFKKLYAEVTDGGK